jgi:hypothetical protein
LIGPDLASDVGIGIGGQLACLAAALSYAFAGIDGRCFQRTGVEPMGAAVGQVSASTVLILPIMLLIDQPWALSTVPSLYGPQICCSSLSRYQSRQCCWVPPFWVKGWSPTTLLAWLSLVPAWSSSMAASAKSCASRNSGRAAQLRLLGRLVRVPPNPQIELKEYPNGQVDRDVYGQ